MRSRLHRWVRESLTVGIFAAAAGGAARAEVLRVEIAHRGDFGAGYEQVTGKIFFGLDPAHPRNRGIADIALAPLTSSARVEFSSDFHILRPKEPAKGNGVALVEISNRGSKTGLFAFRRGGARNAEAGGNAGDEFLFRQGFTLVTVGWEFDVPNRPELMRIHAPYASEAGQTITGRVGAMFSVDASARAFALSDLAAYPPAEPQGSDRMLRVRDGVATAGGTEIPRERWSLKGGAVVMEDGFEPGRTYEVFYRAENPPIAGLGFAAIRDATAWLKHAADALAPVRHAVAFGSSQSGRFLRDFVYQGFNTDERDRAVFDGVMAHIAGAARIDFNRRWSVPRELGTYRATSYPFSDAAQKDPVTGRSEGELENPRVTHAPKIFYTNTSVEYWGGGRAAALVHTDPAGAADVALPENVRVYMFAGTQHGPGALPAAGAAAGPPYVNPVNYWVPMRALLVAMQRWVTEGKAPPPSVYPTFRTGTLVAPAAVKFPEVAGMFSPKLLTAGLRARNPLWPDGAGAGAPLPLRVSQVDDDGNELAGIRLPEVAVPLGTYTGWVFRSVSSGGTRDLIPLRGAWIPFAATREARTAARDARRSIAERYPSREAFLAQNRSVALELVKQGYVLADDVDWLVEMAGGRWDWLAQRSGR